MVASPKFANLPLHRAEVRLVAREPWRVTIRGLSDLWARLREVGFVDVVDAETQAAQGPLPFLIATMSGRFKHESGVTVSVAPNGLSASWLRGPDDHPYGGFRTLFEATREVMSVGNAASEPIGTIAAANILYVNKVADENAPIEFAVRRYFARPWWTMQGGDSTGLLHEASANWRGANETTWPVYAGFLTRSGEGSGSKRRLDDL